ncbi:MAG: hypothetical protein JKX73_00240, partial [Flavobacteriales bacterium]|nr:hypothetical protein [Flavobacteriales bacterium]
MKIAKRIALFLFLLVFLVVTSGIIIAYVYQDRVKEYLVGEISKNLEAETGVSEIEFSVLRKFPMASLSFSQIWCKSTGEHMTFDTLFAADRLFLQFHVMDIFSNNYSITQVDLENARVNIEFNKYGDDNYHFWKEVAETDTLPDKAFAINLDRMVFDNTHINYLDVKRKQDFAFQTKSMLASGSLMDTTGLLSLGFDAVGEKLIVGETDYIKNKRLIGSVDLSFDSEVYEILRGDVSVDGLQVSVDGYIDKRITGASERELALKFLGSGLDITNTLALLPDNDLVRPYTITGEADLIISIKDDLNTRKAPVVTIDFKTEDATLRIDTLNLTFAHIELDGKYSSYYGEDIDGASR